VESARLWLFQMRVMLLMTAGGMTLRDDFARLGVDQSEMQRYGFRLQSDVLRRMRGARGGEGSRNRSRTRGLLDMSRGRQDRINSFLFPKAPAEELAPWHAPTLRTLLWLARTGDRWLAARARG